MTNPERRGSFRKQRNWDREEEVLLVTEYFRTKNFPRSEVDKSITYLSNFLRMRGEIEGFEVDDKFRNEVGIEKKFGNLKSLDKTYTDNGRVGYKHISHLDERVLEEYLENPENIKAEAYDVLMKYCDSIFTI